LAAIGTNLYAGGVFNAAGGINATRVAKWDGIGWSPLGSGVYRSVGSGGTVFALAAIGNDLFAGGTHQIAGTNRSYFVARWNDAIDFTNPGQITLGDAMGLGSGRFRFTVTVSGVTAYVIEQSNDLTAWLPAHTNNISPFHYTNSETLPRRFYRVVGR